LRSAFDERVNERPTLDFCDIEQRSDPLGYEPGFSKRPELDPPDAIGICSLSARCQLKGKPGLSASSGAGQCDQSVRLKNGSQLRQLGLSAEELR
jgi:hypothetical protein